MLVRSKTCWTEDEDAELLALTSRGVSVQRISVRLKRTKRAITVRLSVLRHNGQPKPEELQQPSP